MSWKGASRSTGSTVMLGRGAFAKLRKGAFVVCRIVPVHPATDAWLVSGHLTLFGKSARGQIALVAARNLAAHPELLRRNPALLRHAWQVQAEHRAEFIAQAGADLVVLPPAQAQEVLREHYRRVRDKAMADLAGRTSRRVQLVRPRRGRCATGRPVVR